MRPQPLRRRAAGAAAALLAALATATCAAGPTAPAASPAPEPARVLFIGNSLTYENDLPGLVGQLSRAAGRELSVKMLAHPNYGLEDHWNRSETLRTIADGDWDVVVLQQGPSSLESSREHLRLWTRRFAPRIREAGAVPALYMVWPAAARAADFPRVSESYRLAAEDVDGLLLPAGDAWQAAWRLDPAVSLYGPDAFHPSVAGSYLAALTIVGRFYDVPLTGLPAAVTIHGGTVALPPATAATLQAAAESVR